MSGFVSFPEGIDAKRVPFRTLSNGRRIPAIGLGTFGSDHVSARDVASLVGEALRLGYRYIDCAACYGNEPEVGAELKRALDGGLPRDELFILSKVWNDCHSPQKLTEACKKSIRDLNVGYLDCYLIHWPFPNYHAPGCDVNSRNPASRPYFHDEFMESWRAMERLVKDGFVRSIGVSNVTIPKLELILRDASVKPAVNEMELHPTMQQGRLFQYCIDHGIQPIGYSPIGSPARPERDRTPEDISDLEMPEIIEIAHRHGIHPATVCVKWAFQRGQIPIPFTTKPKNALSNLKAIISDPLSPYEMEAIAACERNCRLIKGQVFLWKGAGSWLDLWDIDGTIPGWDSYK
ncbi:MAG: aldo/keto reductase [Clostridiales bacterium]|nr:aldo/keto reductase [Clostridiales bacterium]